MRDGAIQPLDHGQDGGGKGVRGDVEKNHIGITGRETFAGPAGTGGGIDQAEIDDLPNRAQPIIYAL